MNYSAWCPGNLRYDRNLDKYVDMISCVDTHVNPTQSGLYVTYIDPITHEADAPVVVKFVEEDGVTEIVPGGSYGMNITDFRILDDGRYITIKDNIDDNSVYRFISSDYGVT